MNDFDAFEEADPGDLYDQADFARDENDGPEPSQLRGICGDDFEQEDFYLWAGGDEDRGHEEMLFGDC